MGLVSDLLEKTNVHQCEDLVAILGTADKITRVVRQGQIYEKVFLQDSPTDEDNQAIRKDLVEFYKKALELLAHTHDLILKNQARQFLDALIEPGIGEGLVSGLFELEQKLANTAQALVAKQGHDAKVILQGLSEPLRRIDEDVVKLLMNIEEEKMQNMLDDISNVRVGNLHQAKRDKMTEGTCEWLLKEKSFVEWEESSCSSILWLQGPGTVTSTLRLYVLLKRWLILPSRDGQIVLDLKGH